MCFELFTFGELTSYPLSFCAITSFRGQSAFFPVLSYNNNLKKKSYLSSDIGFMSCWLYVLMKKKTSICFSVLEIYVPTYLGLLEDIASYLMNPF